MNPIQIVIAAVDKVTPVLSALARPIQSLTNSLQGVATGFRTAFDQVTARTLAPLNQALGLLANRASAVGQRLGVWKPPREVDAAMMRLAQALELSYQSAEKLQAKLKGLDAGKAADAVQRLMELQAAGATTGQRFATLQKELGLSRGQFDRLEKSIQKSSGGMGRLGAAVAMIGQSFLGLQAIAQSVMAKISQAWQLFIGQNETMQQQILGAAANLAATTVVIRAGIEIEDPKEAIQALEGPLKQALEDIAVRSLDLVGVTSSQLTEVFNILISQSGKLVGQSKDLADPIAAASQLTTDFAAALGTMGVPLNFARQEIVSILSGTIDMNSQLAKSLGLSNEMVAKWKAQGTLVDELRQRLEPAVAGNALAAKSIGGITSNIQELLELTTRQAGKPLFGFVVESLDKFYQFLKANQDEIQAIFTQLADAVQNVGEEFVEAAGVFKDQFGEELGQALLSTLNLIVQAFTVFGTSIAGAIKALVLFDQKIPILSKSLQLLNGIVTKTAEGYEKINRLRLILSGQWEDSSDAVELYGQQLTALGNQAMQVLEETGPRLAELQDKQARGIELSEAEQKELRALEGRREQAAASLRSLKGDIDGANVSGAEHERTLRGMSDEIDMLTGKLATVSVESKGMTEVGTVFEDLARKANDARTAIEKEGDGDKARFEEGAKSLAQLTQQRLELGAMSLAQAKEDFRLIMSNTKLSADARLAAEKAYVAAVNRGVQSRLELGQLSVEQARAELESVTQDADLSAQAREDAEKQLTNTLTGEIQKRLDLGQLSIDQAAEELSAIATNTELSAAVRREAEQKYTSIVASEVQKRLDLGQLNVDQATEALLAIATDTELSVASRREAEQKLTSTIATEVEKRLQLGQLTLEQAEADLLAIATNSQLSAQARRDAEQRLTNTISQEISRRIELGEISVQAAADQLQGLISNTQLSAQARLDAERQLTQLLEQELSTRRTELDGAIAQTQARVRKGQLDEVEGVKQVTALRKQQLDLQVQNVESAIARERAAGRTDTTRFRELIAQSKQLQAERINLEIEGEQQIQEARMQVLERQQSEVLDAIRLAETERLTNLQELLNQGLISESDINREKLSLTRDRIEAEIEAETRKLEVLQALPPLSDPAAEAQRQASIRQQIQSTAQLRLQLLENERQQQQALTEAIARRIDRELQATQNASQEQILGFEQLLQLNDTYAQALEQQNKLFQARSELAQTLVDAAQAEIGILQATAKTDKERAQLQELSAAIRLEAVREQNRLELENLEIMRLQNQAALERALIQNQSQQAQAGADVAQAEADLAKADADPTTRAEQRRALELQLQARRQKQESLLQERDFLVRDAAIEEELLALREQGLKRQNQTEERQAALEYAQAVNDPRRRNRLLTGLRREAARELGLSVDRDRGLRGLGNSRSIQRRADRIVGTGPEFVNPDRPTSVQGRGQPELRGAIATRGDGTQEIVGAIDRLREENTQNRSPVTIQSTIQNQFTGADVANGDFRRQIDQQILDSQYRVFRDLERRSAA